MGTADDEGLASDGEGPVREVEVAPFAIDTRAVSNDDFAAFVAATGFQPRPSGTAGRSSFKAMCPGPVARRAGA